MRRAIALARDYSHRRVAFGCSVKDHILFQNTLSEMELEFRGCLQLLLHTVLLLQNQERGEASTSEVALLRMLTPIAKFYTAKKGLAVVSEGMECIGGVGYMENSHIPELLRDVQVLPIWEGTTDVLSHDLLRAIRSNGDPNLTYVERWMRNLIGDSEFAPEVLKNFGSLRQWLTDSAPEIVESGARKFGFAMANNIISTMMIH